MSLKLIKKFDESFDTKNLVEEIIDDENNEFIYKFACRKKDEIEILKVH